MGASTKSNLARTSASTRVYQSMASPGSLAMEPSNILAVCIPPTKGNVEVASNGWSVSKVRAIIAKPTCNSLADHTLDNVFLIALLMRCIEFSSRTFSHVVFSFI